MSIYYRLLLEKLAFLTHQFEYADNCIGRTYALLTQAMAFSDTFVSSDGANGVAASYSSVKDGEYTDTPKRRASRKSPPKT